MATTKLLNLDLGDSLTSIARLTAELKVLKTRFKEAAIGSETFDTLGGEVKTLEAEIKKLTNVTKANTQALGGINTSAKFAEGSLGKLKQQIKENSEQLLKVNVNGKLYKALQQEQAEAVQKRIDIEKQLPSMFKERIKDAIDEANSLKGVKAEMKALTSVVLAGGEGSAEAAKKLAELKDKLDDVKDATNSLKGTGIEKLNASMGMLSEAFQNFDAEKAKIGFQGIGGAMKAIPIFLILEGIKLLIENFDEIVKFAQSFTDVAKEAKKLALEQDRLEKATARATSALELQMAKQQAAITIMEAEGKGLREIEAAEQKVRDIKKQALDLEAKKLAGAAKAAAAKKDEIFANETLEMSIYRMIGAVADENTEKATNIIISKKKAEASVESDKIIADSMKGLNDITAEKIALDAEAKAAAINNSKEIRRSTIDDNRLIKQAKIDLIKDDFERAKAQNDFDNANRKQDLEIEERFYADKKELKDLFDKKAARDAELIRRDELKAMQDFQNEIAQFEIDLIKNNYEKQKAQIALNEKAALEDAAITYADNAEKFNEIKKEITKKYAEENRQLALDYVTKDMEAEAELNVLKSKTYEEQFIARQEQLKLQYETELADKSKTENEKLLIEQQYVKDSQALELENLQHKKEIRNAEIKVTADAFTALNNLAILFSNDQDKLAKLSKVGALINIGANTATAISGLVATAFAPKPATIINPLQPYLEMAAGIVAITTNMMQAKQILNSFEEGGYTGDGNPSEVSTNLGSKPYTYHKSEYVIPARVLGTQQGSELASRAEAMRLGISNPNPQIGGFYDGGFTQRAASASSENQFNQNRMLKDMITNMPRPVVRVTDINKVQSGVERAVITSAL